MGDTRDTENTPFEFIGECDPVNVLDVLKQEQPYITALVLAHIEPYKAAILLQYLPEELKTETTRLIAVMDKTSMEIVKGIEKMLRKKLASPDTYSIAGGIGNAVELINLVDGQSEKQIISYLEDKDPELAEEIKRRLFVFADIVRLEDLAVQKVLRETDSQELAKALKAASGETQDKIFKNMSKRAGEMLREDMEYMGPIRRNDAEEAQRKIVNIIRLLEETGEIFIGRRGDEEWVV